jgi:hypothetical protein
MLFHLAARNQIRSEFYRLENEKDNEKIEQVIKFLNIFYIY